MHEDQPDPRADHSVDTVARLLALTGPPPELSPQSAARLKDAVRPHWQEAVRRRSWWRRPRYAAPLAAAVVLVVAGWQFLGARQTLTSPVMPAVTMVATLESMTGTVMQWPATEAGGRDGGVPVYEGHPFGTGMRLDTGTARVGLRLANGASLRLDTGTRLRFAAPGQLVLESGALYIDSEGTPGVKVATALGTVEEIGTQFEVRLAADGLRIRVREGSVVLHHEKGWVPARSGEELELGAGQELRRGRVALAGDPWDWTLEVAPPFELEGRTLAEFLHRFSREVGRPIRYATPELERLAATTMELRGDIDGIELEDALDYVLPACGVRYRVVNRVLVIEPLTP